MDRRGRWRIDETSKIAKTKVGLGRALFAIFGFDRIHIIGCSRSGTTMLHLAMVCFQDVVLSGLESEPQYPFLRERANLALRFGWRPGRKHYVTKRAAGWYRQVDDLVDRVRSENIGLIHLVRDPRDVMLSIYPGCAEPYVSDELWHASISAADRAFRLLSDYPNKLTLRYEDLVLDSERTGRRIGAAFGLKKNPEAFPINQIKDNFERLDVRFASFALRSLSGLRNMDANSIEKWRRESNRPRTDTLAPQIRDRFEAFCTEYSYD